MTIRPPLLRWVFRNEDHVLTCRVDRQTLGTYCLTIIPQTTPSAARVVTFQRATDAVRQHAVIASALRELGWTVVEYTGKRSPDPASIAA